MAAKQEMPEQQAQMIAVDDLPLCCPRSGDSLHSMHPRVYLPIKTKPQVVCPYCGARYSLQKN